jgi:hypothetical protein
MNTMRRNISVITLVLGLVWTAALCFPDARGAVREDVASEISTLSLGELILRDDFADNTVANMWRVWADDVNNCWVLETNGRLEVRAKETASNAFSGYVANAWRLNPQDDFTMRVDFHYDLKTFATGWVSLGLTPDATDPRAEQVSIQARCADLFRNFKYEYLDNKGAIDSSYTERLSNDGSLYISYSAETDTLYLSANGYGPDYAWGVFPGLLGEKWKGQPVFICLGGGSDGLAISGGHAYLDNLMVESGTIVEASLQEVYRFESAVGHRAFFTMSETEKEKLLRNFRDTWVYKGPAFYAFPDDSDPQCKPVYRFWSNSLRAHFYTINENEKNDLFDAYSDTWQYEGIGFYAYPAGHQPSWTAPVYRLWSTTDGIHFYTISETEKNSVIQQSGGTWVDEGVAWYAAP